MRLLPSLRPVILALVAAGPGTALAASPTPDRPSVAASGHLTALGTIEVEAGGLWSGGFALPVLLKYSPGASLEPRIGADLVGAANGTPGLTGELKLALADGPSGAMAAYAVSAIPLGNEAWWGTLRLLGDIEFSSRAVLTLNSGADFVGGVDGPQFVAIPAVAAFSGGLFNSVGGYVEGATSLVPAGSDIALGAWIVDGGLSWSVTDIAVVDAAAGWDFGADAPFVAAGATVNLGRPGG